MMPSLRFVTASAFILVALTPSPCCRAFTAGPVLQKQQQAQKSTSMFSHNQGHAEEQSKNSIISSRRSFVTFIASATAVATGAPLEVNAAPDCFKDCFKNCKLIAPKDQEYCTNSCQEYCAQPDRTDGLSGSVSSEGGEVGILGINTVVKGEDKPPEVKLPGLDFTSAKGKQLLGY